MNNREVDWDSEFKSMSPHSQSRARQYFDDIVRPQGIFLEEKLH